MRLGLRDVAGQYAWFKISSSELHDSKMDKRYDFWGMIYTILERCPILPPMFQKSSANPLKQFNYTYPKSYSWIHLFKIRSEISRAIVTIIVFTILCKHSLPFWCYSVKNELAFAKYWIWSCIIVDGLCGSSSSQLLPVDYDTFIYVLLGWLLLA